MSINSFCSRLPFSFLLCFFFFHCRFSKDALLDGHLIPSFVSFYEKKIDSREWKFLREKTRIFSLYHKYVPQERMNYDQFSNCRIAGSCTLPLFRSTRISAIQSKKDRLNDEINSQYHGEENNFEKTDKKGQVSLAQKHNNEQSFQYFASCSPGLEEILHDELLYGGHISGLKNVKLGKAGVLFEGSKTTGYEAVVYSRVANSIWEKIAESHSPSTSSSTNPSFHSMQVQGQVNKPINNRQALYDFISSIDWETYMTKDQTIAVNCINGNVAKDINHSHYNALQVKNAIVDQFRNAYGTRPSVDSSNPDIPLVIYLHNSKAILYRSLGGLSSLHKRGYRDVMHTASLRENLAAALVYFSGWGGFLKEHQDNKIKLSNEDGRDKNHHHMIGKQIKETTLCDPMCGSATIAIEAALMASNQAPGIMRIKKGMSFPVSKWIDIDKDALRQVLKTAKEKEWCWDLSTIKGKTSTVTSADANDKKKQIMVNDIHSGALSLALKDAHAAGVEELIAFNQDNINRYQPPSKPDIILTNPPWNLRLSTDNNNHAISEDESNDAWDKLGLFLSKNLFEHDRNINEKMTSHEAISVILNGAENFERYEEKLENRLDQTVCGKDIWNIRQGGVDLRLLTYFHSP